MTLVLCSYLTSVSGRVEDLVFYVNGGVQYARRYVVPRNPDTADQRIVRSSFASAVAAWRILPLYKKTQWNGSACHMQMSGYNLFISKYLKPQNGGTRESLKPVSFSSSFLPGLSVFDRFQPETDCSASLCFSERLYPPLEGI